MAKKGKLSTSTADKAYYAYAKLINVSVKNRTNRLKRYVAKNPNDLQAKKALDKGLNYRRKKSQYKIWSPRTKELAHQLKIIGYKKAGKAAMAMVAQEYNIQK